MFYRLSLLIGLFISENVCAQCSTWNHFIFSSNVSFADAAADRFGNTYVVGGFQGSFTLGSQVFTFPGDQWGPLIAKFDKDYALVWAKALVTSHGVIPNQVEVGPDDNVVVAGNFDTSVSFGALSLSSSGRSDVFVAKFAPDGMPIWLIGSSGLEDGSLAGLTISPGGNTIVISNFVERSGVAFGGVPIITGAVDQFIAGYDSFVASIKSDGTVAWTQGIGGDGNAYDYVHGVTTDSGNNTIVTGYFNSPSISFDGKVVHSFMLSQNYYLAKIDPFGETIWVRETEGNNNQGGIEVATDSHDNIFVTGNYYGTAKFGPFTLPGKGYEDVFVAKLTADGTVIGATSIGSHHMEYSSTVRVDGYDQVWVAADYYSDVIAIGPFSSTHFGSLDAFVATFCNDLTTPICVKFITGNGDASINSLAFDVSNNVVVTTSVRLFEGIPMSVSFDANTFTDQRAVLSLLENTRPGADPDLVKAFLGPDTTLCPGQALVLQAGNLCAAPIVAWSTGNVTTKIEVLVPGLVWAEVTQSGKTFRDSIQVSYLEAIDEPAITDAFVCQGESFNWTLPVNGSATYTWNDGSHSNQKSVTLPGAYWVEVSNQCETIRKIVTLEVRSPSVVSLGNDIETCDPVVVLNYDQVAGETLLWSDGSNLDSLVVTSSGKYGLVVDNGCAETTDEVEITIFGQSSELEVPNVVTANGDGLNDHFVLPAGSEKASLFIFNRWGERVAYFEEYNGDWPSPNVNTGVYYYSLQGKCTPESKGTIDVKH